MGSMARTPGEEMMAKGILIAAMDFSAAPEDEFHDWYDLEHIPERLVAMNVAPDHESEFNEWYSTEHIPALGSVPGTLCARRYRGTGARQRYAALYHLATPDVVRTAAWKEAANTPWTEKMRPHFR